MFNSLLERLRPYTAGEQPADRSYIKLNTNESCYEAGAATMRQLAAARELRLYPDPEAKELRDAIARRLGTERKNIFVGNGSDEVLAFLFLALFDREGKGAASLDVTYSFYPVYANLFGIKYKEVPLKVDMTVDIAALRAADAAGILLANPNAPTGIALKKEEILELAAADRQRFLVVDEAYVDFGGESVVDSVAKNPNIIVVRTFSKAYSLAGARVGYAVADSRVIAALDTVKNSFNSYTVGSLSQAAARAALEERAYYEDNINKIIAERDKTARELARIGYDCLPSDANFLFVQCPKGGKSTYEYLKKEGILVRYFDAPRTAKYIRVTVGKPQDMAAVLTALKAFN